MSPLSPSGRAKLSELARDCLLKGKRCTVLKWEGVYPNMKPVVREYVHVCSGPVDPHHSTKKSLRGHDHTAVPLCRLAHDEADRLTNEQFRAKWGVALPMIAAELAPKPESGGTAA